MAALSKSGKRRATDAPAKSTWTRVKPSVKKTNTIAKPEPKISKPRAPKSSVASLRNQRPSKKLQVYVFGEGGVGELGLGTKDAQNVARPRLNKFLVDVVSIATGGMHGAALTSDNKVLTWGVNDNKALGRDTEWDGGMRDVDEEEAKDNQDSKNSEDSEDDGSDLNPREATPTSIPSDAFAPGTQIVQVAAGDSTTFFLTSEGFVFGCGTFRDSSGVYGFTLDPESRKIVKYRSLPTLIPNLESITSICAGADFALALSADGRVFAWGIGQQQQLGRRVVERRRPEALLPAQVGLPKTKKFASIHAGSDHAFAIDEQGNTWAWGLNNFGQTGVPDSAGGDDACITGPRRILLDKKLRLVHGGRHHSIGVTTDGECLVWGRMDGGQMGLDFSQLPLNDETQILLDYRERPRVLLRPTALPIPTCVHATAGSDHCVAVTASGDAYSWGFNVNYQCGQGKSMDDIFVAKPISRDKLGNPKFSWAGAGGQYSMLASEHA